MRTKGYENVKQRGYLLASFLNSSDEESIMEEVNFIVNNLELTNKYIFLFAAKDDRSKLLLTYNTVVSKGKPFNPRLFTMRVHRKKLTNTLYTINALNAAVAQDHGGKTGKNLKLDWQKYENSLLLTEGKKLTVYPHEVVKIFKIEEPPEEN